MSDLVEFLTARYDEVEAAMRVKMTSRRMIAGKMVDVPLRENPRAWALPPSVVLAEVKAKRRILELHRCIPDHAATVLRLLALPYADHIDYQPEWSL